MLFRGFKWDITNMPFFLDEHKKELNNSDNGDINCCICLSNFKNNDRVVKVFIDNSTKTEKKVCSIAHDKCMFKYFETQVENAKSDMISGRDDFKFRCPMRNIINFKQYAENIDDIIREKMKN
jgi:hypothetical protein